MFCSGCGTQIQSGLNYCSRCGRRVAEDEKSVGILSNPTAIAGMVGAIGFIAYIPVLRILTRSGIAPDAIIPITFVYFLAVFGLCFMFLRRGSHASRRSNAEIKSESAEVNYLRPGTTAQLEEGRPFAIGSVTDATTRTLDKVPIGERKKRNDVL
jgi:hypothetical protein